MSPSLPLLLGLLLGVLIVFSMISVYLLIKVYMFIFWIYVSLDDEDNRN